MELDVLNQNENLQSLLPVRSWPVVCRFVIRFIRYFIDITELKILQIGTNIAIMGHILFRIYNDKALIVRGGNLKSCFCTSEIY